MQSDETKFDRALERLMMGAFIVGIPLGIIGTAVTSAAYFGWKVLVFPVALVLFYVVGCIASKVMK